jgi:hypothetical protein
MVTLGRSILEHAAQAWWLLDPSLEARSRLARIITLQLHDLHDEDRELERISNLLADQLQARERSEALQAVAREKGFRVLTPRRSAPAIEEEWPATIRLVGQLLEDPQGQLADELVPGDRSEYGRIIYSQWSAVAHGRVRSIVKEPDATELAMATAVIARGFSAAFERQLLAYGWDTQQWTDTRRATSEAVEWMLSLHDDGTWEQPAARSNARPLP